MSAIGQCNYLRHQVYQGACEDWCCQDFGIGFTENTADLVDEIFRAIKATSNAEAKALIIKSLLHLHDSEKIVKQLLPLVSKDQNETSLASSVRVSHIIP